MKIIGEVMFLKTYIPRNSNLVGSRIVGLVGFLTKNIAYENGSMCSSVEFGPSLLFGGDKA